MPYPNIIITTQTGLSFITGEFVQLIYDSNTYIFGQVVIYDPITGNITVTPTKVVGTPGDYCGWQVIASGSPGTDAGETISLCGLNGGISHLVDSLINSKFDVQSVVYDYTVTNGTLYESGTLTAVWNPFTNVINYTQTATSIGTTTNVIFSFSISGNDIELNLNLTAFPSTPLWNLTLVRTNLAGCSLYTSGQYIITEGGDYITTESSDRLITE